MIQQLTPAQAIQAALQCHHAGDLVEAERLCRQVLLQDPNHFDGLHVLGFVLAAKGQMIDAIDFYRRAISQRNTSAQVHNNLGVALGANGQTDEAIAAYQQALNINPKCTDALINLGVVLAGRKELDATIATYRRAIEIDPASAAAFNNLGAALAGSRKFDEAIDAYCKAIRLKPDYADGHNNLGVIYWDLDRQDEAWAEFQAAIRSNPALAAAHNNLGNYFLTNLKIDQAINSFRKAISLKNDFVDAYCNLGIALMEVGAYDEAGAVYTKVEAIAPNSHELHWNIACHSLIRGDFARGWTEYEWRWQTKARSVSRVNYPQPNWCGEPLNGQTILLYTEQGLGDSIQFIRYATLVAIRGGRVILKCHPELAMLMKGVAGIEQIVTSDELPHFDVYLPLMSLPLVFSTRLETIPANVPYIRIDPNLWQAWGRKIDESKNKLKIGLVWAGGAAYKNDRKRSTTLAQLAPLARVRDTVFYSLQKGSSATQIAHPPADMELIDLTEDLHDFADTAALISHLDLVISVDTAVAHLAGALGKPVWLMLPMNPDWRWLLNRDDSPWYPTMRLFRQTKPGEWADVIEYVAQALAGLRAGSEISAAPRQMTTADAIALAWQHHQAGRFTEAAAIYREIIAQQPGNSDALHLMGLAAMDAKQPEAAAGWISRAVAINPSIPDYQHNLGLALSAAGKFAQAIDAYRNVIRLKPDFPEVFYNLGNALLRSECYDEAIDAYEQALKFRPEHSDLHMNLGQALARVSRHEDAVSSINQAIRLNPNNADAYRNLGLALMQIRRMNASLAAVRQAIAIDPNSIDSHWLLAALSLLLGDFDLGWKEYEWRTKGAALCSPHVEFAQPRWDGGDLRGRTILLHAEQGLGDTLQFIRYAPLVAQRGGRVIVQCPAALSRLFKTVCGISEIVTSAGSLQFDTHAPLLSLPLVFGTKLDSIPADVPYLHADDADVKRWASRIASEHPSQANERRIGLVWAGGPTYKDDHNRSITLAQFSPLASVPNATFFSLQKGLAAAQANEPPREMKWVNLTPDLTNFAETAALISQLDLVISVDTAVAHLAGAMGKPVWILLPFDPDWRWMLDRPDSPWYPTMRLFRQQSRGNWEEVIATIGRFLRQYCDYEKIAGTGGTAVSRPNLP